MAIFIRSKENFESDLETTVQFWGPVQDLGLVPPVGRLREVPSASEDAVVVHVILNLNLVCGQVEGHHGDVAVGGNIRISLERLNYSLEFSFSIVLFLDLNDLSFTLIHSAVNMYNKSSVPWLRLV